MNKKTLLACLSLFGLVLVGCANPGPGASSVPPTVNKYTITWKDDDGSVIRTDTDVEEGSLPTAPTSPTKEDTAQYHYTFNGWSPAVVAASADATYTATYSSEVRQYHVIFNDHDGTELYADDFDYGTEIDLSSVTPSRADTADTKYNWIGWDSEVTQVTEAKTYTAVYESTHLDFELVSDHYEVNGVLSASYAGPIHIPATWKGMNVTAVQTSAFQNNHNITAVTIDEGITYIAPFAFAGTYITSIDIPASVTTIDQYAFQACTKLASVTLHEGLSIIRANAFDSCALQEFSFPASVSIVGPDALCRNIELTRITFNRDASFVDYDGSLYRYSSSLTEIVYPNYSSYTHNSSYDYALVIRKKGVNLDAEGTFERVEPNTTTNEVGKIFYIRYGETDKHLVGAYGNSGAKKILHTTDAKYIKKSAFQNGNSYLLDEVYISADTVYIGSYSFYQQSQLNVLEFASSDVTLEIAECAFRKCNSLEEVDMSERKITTLYTYTFAFCENLKSVTLNEYTATLDNRIFAGTILEEFHVPKALSYITGDVFQNVVTIKEFTIDPENTNFKVVNGNLFTANDKEMVYYACGKVATTFDIPSGTETLRNLCFQDCALTTISIPSSIAHLREWSFYNMNSITSITYDGTLAQFTAIDKSSTWASGMKTSGKVTGVTCSDGEFAFPS